MEKLRKKVLMICTGGTIGMLPKDDNDPLSPLIPASWEKIKQHFTALEELQFDVETNEMELIDSSDMHPDYWEKLAKSISDNYNNFDGFVILHGTDTMAYTATALSFMFENLSKPVVVTGSQLPLAKARTDASQNLVTALMIAASDGVPLIPEVCILFDKVLLRGNRTRKVSSSGFAGFDSPNCLPLASIGEHINVNTKIIRKPSTEGFYVNEFLENSVLPFDIFPGISPEIIEKIFNFGLKGVVMKTYGVGNIPTDKKLLKKIGEAVNKGLAIVNVTQCMQGMVEMGLYDASIGLLRNGVISGVDMTPEAALVKMMFLLGQGYDIETVKHQMQKNLCGEQSVNVFNFIYKDSETKNGVCTLPAQQIPSGFEKEKIIQANIRFEATEFTSDLSSINLAVFMNYPKADPTTDTTIAQCLGEIQATDKNGCMIDCTERVIQVIAPGRPVNLTIVSKDCDVSWESMVLSIYTDANN